MINTLKWSIMVAALLASLVGLPYYYHQNQLNKARLNDVIRYTLSVKDSALVYKNKYDQAVTQIEASRLDNKTMKALKEDLEDITSRFDNLNRRLNNVESLSKVTLDAVANLEGNLQDTVVVRDSSQLEAFKFTTFDPHFKVEGLVIPSLKKVELTPSLTATIYSTTYWKRKHKIWFIRFGRKEYKSEITSDNPYINFSDYKVVIKKE